MRILIVSMLLLAFGSACDTNDVNDGEVQGVVMPDGIRLLNGTDKPIYYFAIGLEASAYVDWFPIVDDEWKVGAGDRVMLGYEDLLTNQGESHLKVYWWHAAERDGRAVPGAISSFTLDMRGMGVPYL